MAEHADGFSIKYTGRKVTLSRTTKWPILDKYIDPELGVEVTRYKPAYATQKGFTDII